MPKNAAVRAIAPRLCGLPMPSRTRIGLLSRCPTRHERWIERGERPRSGNRGNAAMQYGAGNPRQFGCLNLAIRFVKAGQLRAETRPWRRAAAARKTAARPAPDRARTMPRRRRARRSEPARARAAPDRRCRNGRNDCGRAQSSLRGCYTGGGIEPGGVIGKRGARRRTKIDHMTAGIDPHLDLCAHLGWDLQLVDEPA